MSKIKISQTALGLKWQNSTPIDWEIDDKEVECKGFPLSLHRLKEFESHDGSGSEYSVLIVTNKKPLVLAEFWTQNDHQAKMIAEGVVQGLSCTVI